MEKIFSNPKHVLISAALFFLTIVAVLILFGWAEFEPEHGTGNQADRTLSTLYCALSETQWTADEYNLNAWGRFDKELSAAELMQCREKVVKVLEEKIDEPIVNPVTGTAENDFRSQTAENAESGLENLTFSSFMINVPAGNIYISLKFQLLRERPTMIILDISSKMEGAGSDFRTAETGHALRLMNQLEDAVYDSFRSLGVNPIVTAYVKGTYEGKLDTQLKNRHVQTIFDWLKATQTGVTKDERTESINGYSPRLKEWIMDGKRMVNVNLALRYIPDKDQTWLWLGSPVISVEY